ncbi:MAG TPA: methyltransferase domain-containing protein [Streptosporangiaceae bacterium]|nr:methyltransferase domain-containing protein [Streptosporangiaceae bacterium]
MRFDDSRSRAQAPDDVQCGNRSWWSEYPLSYDWHGEISLERGTREWFDEIDRRFVGASRPYLTAQRPFDRIMPDDLQGQQVLEIGCGMGLHSLELARRGARVHAVDLTDAAVEATAARMTEFGMEAEVRCADAESLPYDDQSFDFVWSWGVIHHSARTARIVREIARVLKPRGETRVMVYNREALIARCMLLRHYILGGEFVRRSPDETLWRWSDGYSARYYHKEQFEDLFRGFFEKASGVVLGQEVDVVPLPRRVRGMVASHIPDQRKLAIASRVGAFIFLTASNPLG